MAVNNRHLFVMFNILILNDLYMEIWKEIPGYEGLYEVSNTGMIRSLRYNKIMIPNTNRCGYEYINLCKDGIIKTKTIHRLVAQVFIPNPDNLPIVNHKDEDKTNNNADNLEWCNQKYNVNYGMSQEKRKCTKIKLGQWYGLNKEDNEFRLKDYYKKWYEDNIDRIKENRKIYYQKNKEEILKRQKEYKLKK